MIEIRLYNSSNQNEIEELVRLIASEFELPISNGKKTEIPALDKYWVAFNEMEVIGTIGVLKINNSFSILKNMFLKKAYRGKNYGIALLLLNKVVDWCHAEGINQIYLGTMSQFKAAQKFYVKNGFERIKIHELPSGFIQNPIDDIFYVKQLLSAKTK